MLPCDHPHVVAHAEELPYLRWQNVEKILQLLVLRLDHHAPGGRHLVHDAHEVLKVALHHQHRVPLAVSHRRGRRGHCASRQRAAAALRSLRGGVLGPPRPRPEFVVVPLISPERPPLPGGRCRGALKG